MFLLTAITLWIAVVSVSAAPPQPMSPLACQPGVMPMGDSITAGVGSSNDGGYRLPLFNSLDTAGYAFDFVGTQNDGAGFDTDHEGYPGEKTSSILLRSNNMLNMNDPDVILLHVGTNDMNSITLNNDAAAIISEAVDNVSQMLDNIDAYEAANSKTITVFVARIINQACDASNAKCAKKIQATSDYNIALQAMIDARNDNNIMMVDMETGAGLVYDQEPTGDFAVGDDLHPSNDGYSKMATVWFSALESSKVLECEPPVITSTAVTAAQVGAPYHYQVTVAEPVGVSYTLTNKPSGMQINAGNGLITWTPSVDQLDTYNVTVMATNGAGNDTQSFQVVVKYRLFLPAIRNP